MTETTQQITGFASELGEAVRRNPLSAALIGMGVLWLFAGGKSAFRADDLLRKTGLDRVPETARETLASVTSGIGTGTRAVKDAASSSLDVVREGGAEAVQHVTSFANTMPHPGAVFKNAHDNLSALFEAQPLALGAIGLAIGAGIAAALPGTDVEDAYLGEASEAVRAKTAEMAGEQINKVTTLATDVVDAATEEARKQGLTPEGVKKAAADVSERLGRVANAARADALPSGG